ncbi:MAG TPA: hypothetical protein VI643_05680 [Planctomycetota bacterium]|nr:hypothetical protein [Planctomycetota bacterium]
MIPLACLGALLLLQDEPGPEDLIRLLGDDAAEVRDKAEEQLRSLGLQALECLRRAADSRDMEVRDRVRRILSDPRMVPVAKAFRPLVKYLASEDEAKWRFAVGELVGKHRKEAAPVLYECLMSSSPLLRFRAGQLVEILNSTPSGGLQYGIVVSRPRCKVGEDLGGVEIWINRSFGRMTLEDNAGGHTLRALGTASRVRGMGFVLG